MLGRSAALRRWLSALAAYAQVKAGVIAAVDAAVWADISARTHSKLTVAIDALLAAGVAAGVVRDDVDARDVILMSWFLAHVRPEEWEARVPRLLDVLLEGLGAGE